MSENNFEENWKQYKQLRNWFWFLWLGFIPICSLSFVVSGYLFSNEFFPILFIAPWVIAWIFVGLRLQLWHCPKCGKWFSGTWRYNISFFVHKCVHCGLKKHSNE